MKNGVDTISDEVCELQDDSARTEVSPEELRAACDVIGFFAEMLTKQSLPPDGMIFSESYLGYRPHFRRVFSWLLYDAFFVEVGEEELHGDCALDEFARRMCERQAVGWDDWTPMGLFVAIRHVIASQYDVEAEQISWGDRLHQEGKAHGWIAFWDRLGIIKYWEFDDLAMFIDEQRGSETSLDDGIFDSLSKSLPVNCDLEKVGDAVTCGFRLILGDGSKVPPKFAFEKPCTDDGEVLLDEARTALRRLACVHCLIDPFSISDETLIDEIPFLGTPVPSERKEEAHSHSRSLKRFLGDLWAARIAKSRRHDTLECFRWIITSELPYTLGYENPGSRWLWRKEDVRLTPKITTFKDLTVLLAEGWGLRREW